MKKNFYLTVSALFVAINVILASLALYSRIPIYMDTLGIMLGVRLLGFKYGVGIAIASSLVNSNFDIFALYFFPAHLTVAIMMEFILRNKKLNSLNDFLKAAIMGIPIIAAFKKSLSEFNFLFLRINSIIIATVKWAGKKYSAKISKLLFTSELAIAIPTPYLNPRSLTPSIIPKVSI